MKCPKCRYTSFNNLTSCKKCGFEFGESYNDTFSTSSALPVEEDDLESGEMVSDQEVPDVSEEVTSIQQSLDEIEAGESTQNEIDLFISDVKEIIS